MNIFTNTFKKTYAYVRRSNANNTNSITVNGANITATGDISVINGKIFVNGENVTPDDNNKKEITIIVTGDTGSIAVDYCNNLTVTGNVTDLQSTSSNILLRGGILGNLQTTSGDVQTYGNVGGDVQTVSGDVECHQVGGNVNTVSGDIKNKKND